MARRGPIERFFSMANDPVKMTETALGALVFLRGDVQAARETVARHVTHDRVHRNPACRPAQRRAPYSNAPHSRTVGVGAPHGARDFHATPEAPREGRSDASREGIV